MRKNDLIKLLQELPGNPEMVLWNGLVQDYMQIDNKLIDEDVVKMTYDHFLEMCRLEECSRRRDWNFQHTADDLVELKRSYAKHYEWEVNPYITQEDIERKRYKRKRVVYINAKLRGKTMHDRIGQVSY